ncbi:MAG: ferrous iron transport protein A [Oligoflexia bacterium]|nr:ferrous iron transport protein A [Oligoflexia bacterium]
MKAPISKLGQLRKGQGGRIVAIEAVAHHEELAQRLMEMGLLEGCSVEVIHEAPFGRDPIAVRVRGALVALRRNEADQITVELDSGRKGA